MFNLRNTVFAAALMVSGAALQDANAMTVAKPAFASDVARTAFVFDEAMTPARLDRFDNEAAQSAAASYFDFDAIITLGALALAGGGLAAFSVMAARRRRQEETSAAEPAWRESVFRAVQADLVAFLAGERQAA